jgi:hypothetical protein
MRPRPVEIGSKTYLKIEIAAASCFCVIPAHAGIQVLLFCLVPRLHGDNVWMPAFAGMTKRAAARF